MVMVTGTARWPRARVAAALVMLALAGTRCGDDGDDKGADARAPGDSAPGVDRAGDAPGGGQDAGGGAPDGNAGGGPDASGGGGMCEPCAATCASDAVCDAPGRCAKFGNGCTACLFCKPAETCGNDIDDDCDGTIDNGCAVPCPGKSSCQAMQACLPPG
jgi:hypothetical protein